MPAHREAEAETPAGVLARTRSLSALPGTSGTSLGYRWQGSPDPLLCDCTGQSLGSSEIHSMVNTGCRKM